MSQDQINCRLVAILNVKAVRYNRLRKEAEKWAVLNLRENKKLIGEIVHDYKGQVIESKEDSILACFCSSIKAVECAVKIQESLKDRYSESAGNPNTDFPIGIDIVEAPENGNEGYSHDILTYSRLDTITRQGGICISRRVHSHINTKLDLIFKYLGEFNVKNANSPMWVYRVIPDNTVGLKVAGLNIPAGVMSHKRIIAVFIALIFIAAGVAKLGLHKHGSANIIKNSMESGQVILVFNVMKSDKRLAVLPFYDSSPDNNQNQLTGNIIENILNSFYRVPDLSTVEKRRCFLFMEGRSEIRNIAKKLGIDYIVVVNLKKNQNMFHLNAQFIDTYNESQICLKAYCMEVKDERMDEISEDIAMSIVKEFKEILKNNKFI